MKGKIETGTRYWEWEIIKELPPKNNMRRVLAKCNCGNVKELYFKHLKSGMSKSCGHDRAKNMSQIGKTNKKHGLCSQSTQRIYNCYRGMIKRCYNPKVECYHRYGGRGIKVCGEWLKDISLFYDWAINNGYEDGLTIDRINVNGNYEPSNCRWATYKEQANNREKPYRRFLTYNGETLSVKQWSDKLGINYSTLSCRINKMGLRDEKYIFMEAKHGYHKKISDK